jgi:hypothetical protein
MSGEGEEPGETQPTSAPEAVRAPAINAGRPDNRRFTVDIPLLR